MCDEKEIEKLEILLQKSKETKNELSKIDFIFHKSSDTKYLLLKKIVNETYNYSNIILDQKENLNLLINKSFNLKFNYGKRKGPKHNLFCNYDKRKKECGRCHKILSFSDYHMTFKASDKPRPYCKKCQNELSIIMYSKKKIKVLSQLTNLKCEKCNLSILNLPSLQFHHLNQCKKEISWREIAKSSLNKLLIKLEKENVIILCSNCHLEEQAIVLLEFKKIIMDKDLFRLNPEKINELVLKSTSHYNDKLKRMHIREKIREWIKKRCIIELLNDGKCIGCGLSIVDHLSAFEMHHLKPEDTKNRKKWGEIESLRLPSIIRIMNEQECIFLCSNCHISIHSRFYEFIEEIFEGIFENIIYNYFIKLIRGNYINILKNIREYRFKINESIRDPLTLQIYHKDNWKIHLLRLYNFSKINDYRSFKVIDLKEVLKISMRHIYKHLNKFIEQNIIEKDQSHKTKYQFTNFGKRFVKNLNKKEKYLENYI